MQGSDGDASIPKPSEIALAMNLVADAGRLMLESSSSVSEVILRLKRFLPALGLQHCQIDATLSSLILSYWTPDLEVPITTMREIRVGSPRLQRLVGTEAVLTQVEHREITIEDAYKSLQRLSKDPGTRLRWVYGGTLVSVAGWVVFLAGFEFLTIAVAVAATLLTLPAASVVERFRLPPVTTTVLAALILGAVPNLAAAAGLSIKVGPAVVGGLFIYLPGRALVSSLVDGLSNAPLSSMARALQAVVTAGALAAGMLVGSSIGAGLGLKYQPDVTDAPLAIALIGAAIGMAGIAIAWSIPSRQLVPTVLIGAVGWAMFDLLSLANMSSGVVSALAAATVGLLGSLIAIRQDTPTSVYNGVAILPLVPGLTLYQGMVALSLGQSEAATNALGDAAITSLAIAVGVALGVAVGLNIAAAQRSRLMKAVKQHDPHALFAEQVHHGK